MGDVATVVEVIDGAGKTGYCLEFFDSEGATSKVLVVGEAGIADIKHTRSINYKDGSFAKY